MPDAFGIAKPVILNSGTGRESPNTEQKLPSGQA
jgi:hypothetical protein